MDGEEELEGFRVVAQALASLGVTHMFGVVGIPVVEVRLFKFMSVLNNVFRLLWQHSRKV